MYSPQEWGGKNIDLLWTNASPSTAFTAQTVSLNLSKYEQIIIQGAGTTTYAQRYADGTTTALPSAVCIVFYANMNVSQVWTPFGCSAGGNGATTWGRQVTTSSTGITFGAGQRFQGASSTPSTDNTYAIPMRIWGVKKSIDYVGKP